MPRRKPASGKQRKEELQIKRAIKRGDAPSQTSVSSRLSTSSSRGHVRGPYQRRQPTRANVDASRRLESSFVKFSPEFLEETKRKASNLIIERPIFTNKLLCPIDGKRGRDTMTRNPDESQVLTLPRRPKWRYDMSKKEVENNELGYFKKWLEETDGVIQAWEEGDGSSQSNSEQITERPPQNTDDRLRSNDSDSMPYAAPLFERNLEVWRQLWRVVEICQVLLLLLDSRCPPLHYPPSLHAYLSAYRPPRKVIFVLTKVDIVGQKLASLWKAYLRKTYPTTHVVAVESYLEKTGGEDNRRRVMKEPHIPADLRRDLVQALKEVHDELCLPPQHIVSDASKMAKWKPPVVPTINWDAVLNAKDDDISYNQLRPSDMTIGSDSNEDTGKVEDFLSVGLIGQPNVGKSSLLNALFGSHKVKASRTPGKTKHFQTLFWSSQVRLVDCPGLVFPAFVDLEMQVLAGTLPISQIPAIPSSIYHALQYLPLERIFTLQHPAEKEDRVEDKRTWRAGVRPVKSDMLNKAWTAMDVLIAFAEKNGWLTAKAGRPDINRAGNYILRALAEGRIKWAFYPPNTEMSVLSENDKGTGIWIEEGAHDYTAELTGSEYAADSDGSISEPEEGDGDSEGEASDSSSASQFQSGMTVGAGMFSALSLDDRSS